MFNSLVSTRDIFWMLSKMERIAWQNSPNTGHFYTWDKWSIKRRVQKTNQGGDRVESIDNCEEKTKAKKSPNSYAIEFFKLTQLSNYFKTLLMPCKKRSLRKKKGHFYFTLFSYIPVSKHSTCRTSLWSKAGPVQWILVSQGCIIVFSNRNRICDFRNIIIS